MTRGSGSSPAQPQTARETTEESADDMDSIEHDDWCDANGCRCGNCPCLGDPWCAPRPDELTTTIPVRRAEQHTTQENQP